MKLKKLAETPQEDLTGVRGLKVNHKLSGLKPGDSIEVLKGEDFTVTAERNTVDEGLAYFLEYEGKKEVVGYFDRDEYKELEENLQELEEINVRSDVRTHKHKRPRCRKLIEPYYCGHSGCHGGIAIHFACINLPFSSKYLCICAKVPSFGK
jgi:hypothetical protein